LYQNSSLETSICSAVEEVFNLLYPKVLCIILTKLCSCKTCSLPVCSNNSKEWFEE